jgi:hypothetical protein
LIHWLLEQFATNGLKKSTNGMKIGDHGKRGIVENDVRPLFYNRWWFVDASFICS